MTMTKCPTCGSARIFFNGLRYSCDECLAYFPEPAAPVAEPSGDADAALDAIRLQNNQGRFCSGAQINFLLAEIDRLTAELAKRDEWARVAKGWIPGDDDEQDAAAPEGDE